MSRIRTVKPEFWRHEELSALPEATHLLAAALLNYADDEGYFNANPKLVQAECSPLREPSVSTHDSLTHLSNVGFIRLGSTPDGKRYGSIVKFASHQRINRPTPSKIKGLGIVWDGSLSTHTQLTEGSHPEQGTGNREQGKEEPEPSGSGRAAPSVVLPLPAGRTPEAEAHALGKQVLGPKAGGQVTKLCRYLNHDWAAVKSILLQAAEKASPAEWIGAVLRGTEKGNTPEHLLFPDEIYRGVQNLG